MTGLDPPFVPAGLPHYKCRCGAFNFHPPDVALELCGFCDWALRSTRLPKPDRTCTPG